MDHRDKLAWALRHIDALKKTLANFRTKNSLRLVVEQHPEERHWGAFVQFPDAPTTNWGLMLGDTVHNLRSSLDALAYAIARQHTATQRLSLSQKQEKGLQFIIADKTETFERERKRRRLNELLPDDAIRIIESLQPYQSVEQWRKVASRLDPTLDLTVHPLAILRDLSNIDKHRRITVTNVAARSKGIGGHLWKGDSRTGLFLDLNALPIGFQFFQGQFENGDLVATWPDGPTAANLPVSEYLRFSGGTTFGTGSPDYLIGRDIAVVAAIHRYIKDCVFPPLEKFISDD